MKKLIFISISLFWFAGCVKPVKPVEIKSGKQGGLFEINEAGRSFTFHDSNESLHLDTTTYIPLSSFEVVQQEKSDYEGSLVLNIKLNEVGTTKFKAMSERNISKQICFVVGSKIISAPILQSPIPNGRISMHGSRETINAVIQYLEQ